MANKSQREVNRYVKAFNKSLREDKWLVEHYGVWQVRQFLKNRPFWNSPFQSDHNYEDYCFEILRDGVVYDKVWWVSKLEICTFNRLVEVVNKAVCNVRIKEDNQG